MNMTSRVSLAFASALLFCSGVSANVIYDTTPTPLPGNVVSLGYEATSTTEFGDRIVFAGTERQLTSVTVTMSDWAKFADYPHMNPGGWTHPLTLNLYQVGALGVVGGLIHSSTIVANIPWHDVTNGFSGTAFNVVFSLPNVIVPDEIIFGLAYNTQHYGVQPIGLAGPYNSLNFGVSSALPSVGTDFDTDSLYWNTSVAAFLTSPGPGIAGTFSQDTKWSPYRPAVRFEADPVPEPATWLAMMSFLLALTGLTLVRRATAGS